MRFLNIVAVVVSQAVFSYPGIALTERILPRRGRHLKALIPLPDSGAIIVRQDEAALMGEKHVSKHFMLKPIMVYREITMWV